MLAFSIDYYGIFFGATQSVELFCTYKTISPQARKEANKIIRESLWLDYNAFDSWFVKNGTIENCMDADIHMIQNEKIDEISKVINEDFERLLELQTTNEESVVF